MVINLHIPEDGPMDLTLCSDSIKRIADFFAVYRSDYHWCGFLCQSWLLDRQLRAALDKESNIMKFQNLGIHYVMYPNDDTIFRLFGTADPTSITTPTRLQKFAIKFLQNGGIFIEEGMFIPRREIEAANYDLNKIIKPELLSC